nr:MAG TPA: hypothetical protein [Caudoviricetes sp.]
MDNYRDIESKLANYQPIRGNSLSAYWDNLGNYQVYSYQTLIATSHRDGVNWLDARKYSVTTSRHQNLIKKAWGI